jgi:hypothetical protein
MARIQITDLNSSDSELIEELTDEDLLEINGGGFTWRDFKTTFNGALSGLLPPNRSSRLVNSIGRRG